ncbi:MAG: hypothetical protein AVDCRST_MAG89-5038 [uncultured Gemmatimonadetes bacterium]|uniref:Uncharacterized protein n=1 Tax=uncultured Gemmatimonadota bacterium TaxID=203437 RepID=A0A6J4N3I7_9BACT|nr:MAG: hypothetical protein AVDCRST_MAG89-5038 [uncultured Gemmatimonadota bacterium]
MRISAVHPAESTLVAASQMGSHDGSALGDACPASYLTPDGLIWKTVRPEWSWKVSNTSWM